MAVLHEGKVVESGAAVDVFGHPREPYTRKLLGAVPRLDDARPRAEVPPGEPVLKVRGLTKTFPLLKGGVFKRRVGSVYAVDGVDLDIRRGETLASRGPAESDRAARGVPVPGALPAVRRTRGRRAQAVRP
ncbi:hypothetical protein [Streptomyces sp. NPDC048309]|uniref:ABC transporter ATP-binding protein n=1 Tax=Streptomyces sp. NPDC048309 TaxID=3154618 RepID=UPI0033E4CDEC